MRPIDRPGRLLTPGLLSPPSDTVSRCKFLRWYQQPGENIASHSRALLLASPLQFQEFLYRPSQWNPPKPFSNWGSILHGNGPRELPCWWDYLSTCLNSTDYINCQEERQGVDSDMSVVPDMCETVGARRVSTIQGSPAEYLQVRLDIVIHT